MTTPASTQNAAPQVSADEAARSRQALAGLPPHLETLNRTYLENLSRRALWSATECSVWLDQKVSVFLRHDRVRVFAVVKGDHVGMADFVSLSDARFHVDDFGREQSNSEQGPLPNRRTVHAWLTGRLTWIADHGTLPDSESWVPVMYRPDLYRTFVTADSRYRVAGANAVRMVPGHLKVWCSSESADLMLKEGEA
ncbi:MAG: hypothetical protein R3C49_01425 [Planctomycetaceae bacterium]